MIRASLVLPAVAFALGILAEQHSASLVLLPCAVVFTIAVRMGSPTVRAVCASALALGMLDARFHPPAAPAPSARLQTLALTVAGDVERDDAAVRFTGRLGDGTLVSVSAAAPAPAIAERLTVRARLEPFDDARNPGEPSARERAAERRLAGRLAHARILSRAPPDVRDPATWLPLARAWASRELRSRLDEPFATILAGALWGERSALPPDLRAEFQDTGTVHILVTAGLHLGVVAALVGLLLSRVGCPRIAAALVTIACVWAYAAFSGAHLPSLRAATMISFALVARACGREALSWNALAAASIVVSAAWPASVGSTSFALSFSCVGAILLFAEPFRSALEQHPAFPPPVTEALSLTLATQLGVWPLTAATFLVFAPYAPLANVAVVPAVGVAMLLGLGQLATAALPLVSQLFANANTWVLMWIVGTVRFVGSLPEAHVITTPPPPWAIAVYDAALFAVARALSFKRRGLALALFAGASALVLWPPHQPARGLTVTMLDVGQADAIAIQTPRGHALLVDAGGRLERGRNEDGTSLAEAIGERIVVPFLIRHGIHHLDALLISHPHGDHAGGAAPVLRALGADVVADTGQHYGGFAYRDAIEVARATGTPIVHPRAGTAWRTDDGVSLTFLGPQEPLLTGTRNDINNNSLVFMLRYKSFRMLFTGDAGAEAERRILDAGVDLRADILKVGHHGSAYGSTRAFLEAVRPKYAIISVGRHNLFGHPALATLEALAAAGAATYRTDRCGAVNVTADGTVSTMLDCAPEPAKPQ